MGYIRHRAVLATIEQYDDCRMKEIRAFIRSLRVKIVKEGLPPFLILYSGTVINCYNTYIFAPDGSKLGWETSDVIEKLRQEFMEKMKTFGADIIYVTFGGDESEIQIIDQKGRAHLIYA